MKRLLQFNEDKCKGMHIGKANPGFSYVLGGKTLQETKRVNDLCVLITDDLKPADKVASPADAANSMLWRICKKLPSLMNTLSQHYTRLLFGHVWSSQHKPGHENWEKYCQAEKVQTRATKMIPSLESLPYEDRLKQLSLTTLENRRHHGDMIEVYKILNGMDRIQDNFLELDTNTRTWGNMF